MQTTILSEAISLLEEAISLSIYTKQAEEVLTHRLGQLNRRAEDPRTFIAFIGEKKAGKTALVRALTQVPLPTAVRECTAAVCEIQIGMDYHHHAVLKNGTEQSFQPIDDTYVQEQISKQKGLDGNAAHRMAMQIGAAENVLAKAKAQLQEHNGALSDQAALVAKNLADIQDAKGKNPWLLPLLTPFKWVNSNLKSKINNIQELKQTLLETQENFDALHRSQEEFLIRVEQAREGLPGLWEEAKEEAKKHQLAIMEAENSLSLLKEKNKALFERELHKFIDVANSPAERISILSPNADIPPNIVILDTPGLNTDLETHRRRAWEAIEELSDICILVSDLRQPMPDTVMDMLDRIGPYCPYLHVALTKRDLALMEAEGLSDDPLAEVEEAETVAKARIKNRWPKPLNIWSVASITESDQLDVRTKFKSFWESIDSDKREEKNNLLAATIITQAAELLQPEMDIQKEILSGITNKQLNLEAEAALKIEEHTPEIKEKSGKLVKRIRLDIRENLGKKEELWANLVENCTSKSSVREKLKSIQIDMTDHAQLMGELIRDDLKNGIERIALQYWDGDTELESAQLVKLQVDDNEKLFESAQDDDSSWMWTAGGVAAGAAIGLALSGGLTLPLILAASTGGFANMLLSPLAEAKDKAKLAIEQGVEQAEKLRINQLQTLESELDSQIQNILIQAVQNEIRNRMKQYQLEVGQKETKIKEFQARLWDARTRYLRGPASKTNVVPLPLHPVVKSELTLEGSDTILPD